MRRGRRTVEKWVIVILAYALMLLGIMAACMQHSSVCTAMLLGLLATAFGFGAIAAASLWREE